VSKDIKATFGECEFGGSREFLRANRLPKKGWYAWPSDCNSLEAWTVGQLYGPFKNADEAEQWAKANVFEAPDL
jgi:hypothetical protein